ncbi:potassium-transporting ATPase subunit KdpC [Chryseobacterium taklimakanense]|uniref:Potassium-transporting ATPase KdpC subunit n=1 Tax=Chryseobacterium taklimakanense TaxID=536441 RepID=A0A3G8WK29_9FLAO|nr:potassium-transporting ATPase subunit KdpC [Chryseobacterium taklimakanense]AZI20833.1 potassium-transporting ATPase subunit KdpC [Chryseobacterium taklimakanense]
MKNFIKPAIVLTLSMIILISLYTVIVYGLGKVLPNHGEGEQIAVNGKRYYTNIAQQFKSPNYFHPRTSAVNYNAAGSGGSNKGPSNPEYLADVQKRIDSVRQENPEMQNAEVPVDLVTASGSGLDPDISVKGAEYQIKRIAKERNLDKAKVQKLVAENTESGVFGPSKVNVLKLNLALDQIK